VSSFRVLRRDRWAIFISGTGSNLNALLDERTLIDTALVVSSTPQAYGLVRAKRAGVPTLILGRTIDWKALHEELEVQNIDRIFLMGFMKLLPAEFVEKWKGRIFNVHPSLLPEYPGLKSIERAFNEGQPLGVTVHEVIAEMDSGPSVIQRKVGSLGPITLSVAEFMVHLNEHRLVRESVRQCRTDPI
jgi:phosphoribosylglycinamide formyltransferase 1